MSEERSLIERNALERERLDALVARIRDDELLYALDDGWTVAAALAHLAFWDRRVLALLEHWERHGVAQASYETDIFNAALLPLCLAIPPRAAAQLAVESAAAVDHKIATLPPAMLTAIQALERPPRLERALHRREHLDQIQRAGIC